METVFRNIVNVLVYSDDMLLHTATHEEHLKVLEKVFERLHQNHLKVNLEKCVFGNREVSYLGFMLTPEGIKPGRNKLQAIRDTQPPTNIKMVRSFVGLCNFFCTHIKDFAIIAAPLFKVTRKDSGYKNGPLPPDALHTFKVLQQQLTSEPVMAFPPSDRRYALIMDASTGTADSSGGLGAILTQVDDHGNHYAISFASRQLKDQEQNYFPFLLEAAAAGEWKFLMNTFEENSLSFSLAINHLKNQDICTQKHSIICKQPYWSMILLFSTKRYKYAS